MSNSAGQSDKPLNRPMTLAEVAEEVSALRERFGDDAIFQVWLPESDKHIPVTRATLSLFVRRKS